MNQKTSTYLKGKIAIITGADSGIGQAIADELSSLGTDVFINYLKDKKGADETLKLVEKNGSKGFVQQGDVSDYEQVKKMYESVVDNLGVPFILVNCAGVDASGKHVDEMDIDIFDKTIRTNLYGTFYNCKENGYVL